MRVVALASGGLDSTTLVYWLRARGHDVIPLAYEYGQRHIKEVKCAIDIFGTDLRVVPIADIQKVKPPIPDGHYAEPSMKATVYPNRNMMMIAVAVAVAITEECPAVAYGAHAGDHTIYPDCRLEFVIALKQAVELATVWTPVTLEAPFVQWRKQDIVKIGHELKVPFNKTWSCYRGDEHHCGTCGTCVERIEAFKLASVPDPTLYGNLGMPSPFSHHWTCATWTAHACTCQR